MSWAPTPGTIPAQAVDHLRKQPLGTRLSTAALAEAIGHDARSLAAYLSVPRDMGWLVSGQVKGERFNEWWLGHGALGYPPPTTPLKRLIVDAQLAPKPSIQEAKPEAPRLAPDRKPAPTVVDDESLCRALETRREAERHTLHPDPLPFGGQPCAAPGTTLEIGRAGVQEALQAIVEAPVLPRARAGTAPARWGIFSDGEFVITKGDQKVELERPEFETLLAFLSRTCGEGSDA